MNNKTREDLLTLEILEAIEEQSDLTQRHLAGRANVALGLANAYLKRCARKGLVKIQQAPANRYLYYLTPKGFAEKSRLTARYLSYSFTFYRRASESCAQAFSHCKSEGWRTLVLCGATDLGEIACVRAIEQDLHIAGVLDASAKRERFLGHRVFAQVTQCPDADAWVVTDLHDPQTTYQSLIMELPYQRVVVPRILSVKLSA